ncbi:MAG: hypothetical protein KF718_06270 [Polyangiaceae bacterium]|nr:hypothetical protein [Polyangiaceae bacterium]
MSTPPRAIRCWFVETEDRTYDDEVTEVQTLRAWRAAHPEFVEAADDWFQARFVDTGELFASDSAGAVCTEGSRLLLFASAAAAAEFASRDAAHAAGLRAVAAALAVSLPIDVLIPAGAKLAGHPGFLAVFDEYLVVAHDDEGRRALELVGITAEPLETR